MTIKEIVRALERFAPLPLQDGFDNAGLQIGLTDVEVTGALLCLDVTEKVIDEAIEQHCNLIISHHPPIFRGYKSITGKDEIERCIIKAIKNDITIFSAHTNLDNAVGGVNYKIAELLGLKNVQILAPRKECLMKLVTFVPIDYANQVRVALFNAGCGAIGNYDSCSFNSVGEGSFRAKEGANPFCGSIDKLHLEKESKIETILPSYRKNEVLSALRDSHPYEEPAFDLYMLNNEDAYSGAGIMGELEQDMEEMQFLQMVKQTFKADCLRYNGLHQRPVKRVAVCGGAGSFLIPNAIHKGADAFITGEIKYHDYFDKNQILLAELGHYESEQYTQELFKETLQKEFPELKLMITTINTNPIKYL